MRASAHLKPMTHTKPFLGFLIIQVDNQNAFWRFGVIPMTGMKRFRELKYKSTFLNVPSAPSFSAYQGWVTTENSDCSCLISGIMSIPYAQYKVVLHASRLPYSVGSWMYHSSLAVPSMTIENNNFKKMSSGRPYMANCPKHSNFFDIVEVIFCAND